MPWWRGEEGTTTGQQRKDEMITYIKNWIAQRDLLELSRKENFEELQAERVNEILDKWVESRKLREGYTNSRSLENIKIENALLQVWKLAEERSQSELDDVQAWRTIMASCNALFEQFSGKSRAKNRVLAA